MKIIIVGDGKVGTALTHQLAKEDHDIVVVDQNARVLRDNQHNYDVMTVQGNGASLEVLQEAGVRQSDLLIAVTGADEVNLLSCVLAKKVGGLNTIARVRNPEYTEGRQLSLLKEALDIAMTINPELSAASEITGMIQFPSFVKRESLARGRIELVEIKITEDSILRDIALSDLYQNIKAKVLVCAVSRGEDVYIPSGSFVLRQGDSIHVTAERKDISILIDSLGLQKKKVKSAMIIGGGRITYYLARGLQRIGVQVKIIEKDRARCQLLAELLPGVVVIEGDGSLPGLLLEEGIEHTDALVTLTNIDEENIVIGLHAKRSGVPKVITKINREEYQDVLKNIGLDSYVNPKLLCSDHIVRYVRAMSNTTGGSVISLHRIADGMAEALEFHADSHTRHLGEPFSRVTLQENLLVACIMRRGKSIVPMGSDCIEKGDTVILVAPSDMQISHLNDIFAD